MADERRKTLGERDNMIRAIKDMENENKNLQK